jgi:hypothetical protein
MTVDTHSLNFVIPLVDDESLLKSTGNTIMIPRNQMGGYKPPLVRINGELRRLAYRSDGGNTLGVTRTSPPTNIQPEYYGLPGSTLTIAPSGAFNVNNLPINYIFLDKDSNQLGLNNMEFTFPSTVGEFDDYQVYAVANGSGPSIEFRLIASEAYADPVLFSVENLSLGLPEEVYPALKGYGVVNFDVVASPDDAPVTLTILNTHNITLSLMNDIPDNTVIEYYIQPGSIGDVEFTYCYKTSTGYITAPITQTVPNNLGQVSGTPYGFIQNFPASQGEGDTFIWQYGNVLPGFEVVIINTVNVGTPFTGTISPGEEVPFEVTGQEGEVMSFSYMILYNGYTVGSETVSAFIGTPNLDLSNITVSINPTVLIPGNTGTITFSGLAADQTAKLLTISPYFNTVTQIVENGAEIVLSLGIEYDPEMGLSVPLLVTSTQGSGVRSFDLPVGRETGGEAINISRVFTKPQGVTSLTITGRGGANNVSTKLTGLINYLFEGGVTLPPIVSRTFVDLDPAEDTITFSLATGTVAYVAY